MAEPYPAGTSPTRGHAGGDGDGTVAPCLAKRLPALAMDLAGWTEVVPMALASLVTGVPQSLGTTWGPFRHYWVVVELVVALVATGVLLPLHRDPRRPGGLGRRASA